MSEAPKTHPTATKELNPEDKIEFWDFHQPQLLDGVLPRKQLGRFIGS